MYKKGFAPIIIILVIVAAVALGGGTWYYQKTHVSATANKQIEPVPPPPTPINPPPQTTPPATTNSNSADKARVAAVNKLQLFLTDWQNKYKADCANKETANECIIWKSAIEKIKNTCFRSNLSDAEVTKCGEDVVRESIDATLPNATGSFNSEDPIAKDTIDSHGTDLAKLPQGKTVKVFKNGPTEEASYGNETAVTYERSGDSVTITEVIVYEGNRGTIQYKQTILLK